ncbi:MAG: tryptophan synthase subunit alpha [Polyangiaceae bacterium]|nr:tryptophan synthase subunit alpha [Polyangiaceae bacterium]
MNKISSAFEGHKAFVAFLTGGDPDIETTEKLIVAMAASGADVIEIGIPFSDPVAEGVVIQGADERALAAGVTVDKLFQMVKRVREKIAIPLLFMTYINSIFAYGKERFLAQCADCGISGVIVVDLPYEEREELASACAKYGICQIFMIAPTSRERVETIAKGSEGFLYCVSSLGVTGVRSNISMDVAGLIEQAKSVSSTPCAVGFGISTPEQARQMAAISDGVIVGSAIVKLIAEHGRQSVEPVAAFVKEMKRAI